MGGHHIFTFDQNIEFETSFHQLRTIKIWQNSVVTEMEERVLLWSLTLIVTKLHG